MLKGRWTRLKFVNTYSICKAVEIVTSACVLHNFCLRANDSWDQMNGNKQETEVEVQFQENDLIESRLGEQKRNKIARDLRLVLQ